MSGTREDALFTDPLDALRSADHRPLVERWRGKVRGQLSLAAWSAHLRTGMVAVAFVAVVVAVGWRLFVTSQPPVEDSIPLVQRIAPATASATDPASSPVAASITPGTSQTGSDSVGVGDAPSAALPIVVVHVAGAVDRPGVVEGHGDWRVHDAIAAAGGLDAAADPDRINLAAPIIDGQRIFVPTIGEPEPAVIGAVLSTAGNEQATVLVNINTADSGALQQLSGIGPATADTILAHRDEHGPFATVDALVAVRGIGPATIEGLRDRVTVG